MTTMNWFFTKGTI